MLKDRLNAEGVQQSLFLAHFELGSIEDLAAANYRAANEWLDEATSPA